jgi:outer membrane autotransporter protein
VPDFEAGGSVRATEVSIKTDMAHDARLSTARSTRASAAAIAPAWSESGPNAVVIVPASVSGSEPACASDTFGAPMTAQALQQARSQLDATQARIAQLRQLRSQRDAAKGLSINATGGTQSRREGGNLEAGTQALHVERLDLNVGGDYRLNDQWAFGGGAGAGHSRMTWDGNTSRLNGDSGNLSAYAVYSPSSASFISAAYSLESTHYGLQTDDGFLHKATGVSQGVSLSAGYDLQRGSWTFSPYLRADDISARIGSFGGEQGGTRGRTGSVTAGAQVQTSVPTSWGVVAPHARLELTQITGWHIQGSSAAVYVAGNSVLPAPNPLDIDRQFGLMGLGASAIMQRGLSLFADYDSGFGQKAVSSWRLTFGLRSEL